MLDGCSRSVAAGLVIVTPERVVAIDLFLHRFSREVIEGIRQRSEGNHADPVVMKEAGVEANVVGQAELHLDPRVDDAEQAHDAAGGDEAGGEERAGRGVAFFRGALFLGG